MTARLWWALALPGSELDGFTQCGFGGTAHAFLAEGDAEIVLDLGILRDRAWRRGSGRRALHHISPGGISDWPSIEQL